MTTGADWLDQGRRLLDTFLKGAAAPAEGGTQDHRSDCTWCPLCQVAAVVRGERPEVSAALADVLDATAAALRTFAAAGTDQQRAPATEERGEGDPPAVQRIEIA
jgi:hypothetical protein